MSARDRSFDVCVVGAGVMGLSASHELALRGARVLCVEKGEPGRGATGATAGTLAVQNKRSGSVPLALHAVADWQEMSSRLDHDVEYERRGGVRVADDARSREKLERSAAEQAELGATVEMVEPPDLFELAPYLARSTIAATYCPEDGMANPFATVRGYLDACTRTGNVTFRHGERVSSLEPTDGSSFVVHLDDERIHCGSVLVAVGASIARLLRPLGIDLPLFTVIQQVLITRAGPELFSHIVTHGGGKLTVKQQAGGNVLIGGGWTGKGNSDREEHELHYESVVGNARKAVDTIPGLSARFLLRAWTGLEGRSPDRLPVLGPVPGFDGLHVLGCAAGGFTLGPTCGRIVASLILGEEPAAPYRPYLVSRFTNEPAALRASSSSEEEP